MEKVSAASPVSPMTFELLNTHDFGNECDISLQTGYRTLRKIERAFFEREGIPFTICHIKKDRLGTRSYFNARVGKLYEPEIQDKIKTEKRKSSIITFGILSCNQRPPLRNLSPISKQINAEHSPLRFSVLLEEKKTENGQTKKSWKLLSEAEPNLTMPKGFVGPNIVPLQRILQLDEQRYLKCIFSIGQLTCWIDPQHPLTIDVKVWLTQSIRCVHCDTWQKGNRVFVALIGIRKDALRLTIRINQENDLLLHNAQTDQISYRGVPPITVDTITLYLKDRKCFIDPYSCCGVWPPNPTSSWYFSKKGKIKEIVLPWSSTVTEHEFLGMIPYDLSHLPLNLSCAIAYSTRDLPSPLIDFFDKEGTLIHTWAPLFENNDSYKAIHFVRDQGEAYCLLSSIRNRVYLYKITPASSFWKVAQGECLAELLALLPSPEEKQQNS